MFEQKTVLKPTVAKRIRGVVCSLILIGMFCVFMPFLFFRDGADFTEKSTWIIIVIALAVFVFGIFALIEGFGAYIAFDEQLLTVSKGFSKKTFLMENILGYQDNGKRFYVVYSEDSEGEKKKQRYGFDVIYSSEDMAKLVQWMPQEILTDAQKEQLENLKSEINEINKECFVGKTDVEKDAELKKYHNIALAVNILGYVIPFSGTIYSLVAVMMARMNVYALLEAEPVVTKYFPYVCMCLPFVILMIPLVSNGMIKIKTSISAFPNVYAGFVGSITVPVVMWSRGIDNICDHKLFIEEIVVAAVAAAVILILAFWSEDKKSGAAEKHPVRTYGPHIFCAVCIAFVAVSTLNFTPEGKIISWTGGVVADKHETNGRSRSYYIYVATEDEEEIKFSVSSDEFDEFGKNDKVVVLMNEGLLKVKYRTIEKLEDYPVEEAEENDEE